MRYRTRLLEMTALTLVFAPALAAAQTVPPIPPAPDQAQDAGPNAAGGDPPARVGRLARLSGGVSFQPAGATQWTPATANFPVTTGDAVWVQPQARAEVQVSANRIEITGGTELEMTRLDDTTLLATLPQGEVCMGLRNSPAGTSYDVQTPRGLVQIAGAGHYAMVVGDTEHPTLVTVLDGGATVTAPSVSLQVGAGQTASITGTDSLQGTLQPGGPDQCLSGLLVLERPRPTGVTPPAVVQEMTGAEDLAEYGAWQATPDYGTVWYPQVDPGWVPYRHGHWVFVDPWGWTWVDDAPWGFAPFHYGRWVEAGGRWGWTPAYGGEAAIGRPVYAPALVTFFGLGGVAVGIGIGAALEHGSVGWVPLAPREPYYPWYHASPAYVRQVNVRNVSDISTVVNNYTHNSYTSVTVNRFVNTAGATVVSAGALAASRPVAAEARPLAAAGLAEARPVFGRQVEAPGATTAGVTPAVARAFHLPGVTAAPAPGPQVRPLDRRATLPGALPAALPEVARPAQPSTPIPAQSRAIAPGIVAPARPEPPRPEAVARPEPPHVIVPEARPEPPRPPEAALRPAAPRVEPQRAPEPRPEPAARPVEPREAPRVEAPRPPPRVEQPRAEPSRAEQRPAARSEERPKRPGEQ